jgi:hypothetical protein
VSPGFERTARGLGAAGPCLGLALVPGPPAWFLAAVALVVYALLLVLLRAVPDELMELIQGRRTR